MAGARRQQEIFAATLAMVAERGYDGLTVEGVAERSGVNKTTIYRWWPSKAALLGDALVGAESLEFAIPDTGSLRGDLEALVLGVSELLTVSPAADVAVAALGAAVGSPELAAGTQRFFADRLAREAVVFERALIRGELADGVDPMAVVDLLAGAVWMRVVFRGLPLEADFAAEVVGTVLGGIGSR
ncbi:TetR/AcrR family transcriptional regulator [Sinosporangium siamense]|uniref:TetR family transcriptional regulator n=1 Tax=Sinosporangium siamense TaxID=1367973 RepID=A0A919REW1_9ACTN|nr:TetR/AcrR family transcriptional regulator [Sinosporangium siamense]GII91139.1 TetR family transcriptional regulator [Sinosporangium siamense]